MVAEGKNFKKIQRFSYKSENTIQIYHMCYHAGDSH